jgi:hypothetical protein
MLYDNQTWSMLQTDQKFPDVSSLDEGLMQNTDGSFEIYIDPKPPNGRENNWIQSVPGKGWSTIFRLYSPLQSFFDKTWIPGDSELVN